MRGGAAGGISSTGGEIRSIVSARPGCGKAEAGSGATGLSSCAAFSPSSRDACTPGVGVTTASSFSLSRAKSLSWRMKVPAELRETGVSPTLWTGGGEGTSEADEADGSWADSSASSEFSGTTSGDATDITETEPSSDSRKTAWDRSLGREEDFFTSRNREACFFRLPSSAASTSQFFTAKASWVC